MNVFSSTARTSFRNALLLIGLGVATLVTSEEANLPTERQVGAPKILKLERRSVILPGPKPQGGKRKNFYAAKIRVGEPGQEFRVSFDLHGGTMALAAKICHDHVCQRRKKYFKWQSSSAEDIQANGTLVEPGHRLIMDRQPIVGRFFGRDYGSLELRDYGFSVAVGSMQMGGTFVRDKVCVGKHSDRDESRCFPLAFLNVLKTESTPFYVQPFDGTVGLGLESFSAGFNFLAGFQRGYHEPSDFSKSFGLHIGTDEDGGEITLGGYDEKRMTHPLRWSPVADPQEGSWQVAISAIRIGNNTLDACKGRACRAIIDYSSSLLAVPASLAPSLERVLAFEASPAGFGNGCQHTSVPDLHLDLEGGTTLTLPAEDFVTEFGQKSGVTLKPSCDPLLTHNHEDTFVLGESILRRYYTVFNADTLSVGFSLAAGSLSMDGKNPERLSGHKENKKAVDGDNSIIV
jgi:hypothetical protein